MAAKQKYSKFHFDGTDGYTKFQASQSDFSHMHVYYK